LGGASALGLLDCLPVQGSGCDVAVAGAGLVGLSLAYELACLGAQVTVIDAGFPGRATDAGAGILSPSTTTEEDPQWWEMVQGAGRHYPALLARLATDGVDTSDAHYAVCGILSIGLRPHEDDWFAPFARTVLRRSPGTIVEITPDEARALFPPLGAVHRVLHHPGAARVDGRGMAEALRQATRTRGVRFVDGVVSGVAERGGASRAVAAVRVAGQGDVACDALAVTGGAWSAAMGEWLGTPLPITPTKGQIVHLATREETAAWPIAQPLLTHYLVPWPGGRVACGGTFEVGAGFDSSVTAAGLHELLRECLLVAPGLAGAEYLQTRVGLRPTSVDDCPVVGALRGWSNAWVATGHGANGLLQGPYSSRVLAHGISGYSAPSGEPPLPSTFDPQRFS
jgi:D-amino-acid dehydrogenase